MILLIGFSRMYLEVHYFSDVIGGYAAGLIWLSTCVTAMEVVREGENVRASERKSMRA